MANSLGSLVVRLALDASEYVSGLVRSQQQAQQFATQNEQAFQRVNRAARESGDALDYFKRGLAAVASAYGIRELARLSDEYQNANARLKIFTSSNEELAQLQSTLFGIAQNTRQSLSATTDLYYQLANATQDVGVSQKDLITITQGVNKGLILSGSTGDSARGVIIQLSQALAAGKLRGQEFNTVNEQGNRIMRALAEGLGKTTGELRKMANDGELTTELFVEGFTKGIGGINKEFATIPVTITGALTVAQNEIQKFVGTTFQSAGQTGVFAKTILLIAQNIDILAAATAGYLTLKLAETVLKTVGAFTASTAAKLNEIAATRAAVVAEREALQAKLANLAATEATIVAARAQAIADLQVLQTTTAVTAATKVKTAALIADLALLGRAQAGVAAQTAATNVALAGMATGGVSLLSRSLAAVGGPIGAISIALGIGATAWQYWSSKSQEAANSAAGSMEKSTADIIGSLDKQIQRLRERNRLANAAPNVKGDGEPQQRAAAILAQIDKLRNSSSNADKVYLIDLTAQYDQLNKQIDDLNKEQNKLDAFNRKRSASEVLKEYATDAEKAAEEIKKVRAELGDLFTPEIEKRIRDKFTKKSAAVPGSDDSRKILDGQLKAMEAHLGRERDLLGAREAYLRDTYTEGLLTVNNYYDDLQKARNDNLQKQLDAYDNQLAAAENFIARSKKATDKQEGQNKVDEINAKRENALREAGILEAQTNRDRVRSNQEFADILGEVNAKVLELNGNLEEAARIRFDMANRVLNNALAAGGNDPAAVRGREQQEALKNQLVIQAQLNQMNQRAAEITSLMDVEQNRLNISRDTGATTELESLYQLSDLNAKRAEQLKVIVEQYEKIAALSKDPSDIIKARSMRMELERLESQTDLVAKKFNEMFTSEVTNALYDAATGAKSFKDAFLDMAKSIQAALVRIAAQNVAESLFGKGGSGAGLGEWFSKLFQGGAGMGGGGMDWLSKLFGSFFSGAGGASAIGNMGAAFVIPGAASGGVSSGGFTMVGEKGPEVVNLPMGSRVFPNSDMGKFGNETNNISIMVPGNTSRQSAQQIADSVRQELSRRSKR